ncbi:MAG: flagellin FliC, partial [Bdellovibrionales bacterium]|nr:flagellin FliC [Bdellovibrionales bacterium]
VRLDELAVASANGTLSDGDRAALKAEFDSLVAEADRIAQTTEFNGQQLLASDNTISGQVGVSGDDTIDVSLKGSSASALGLSGIDIGSQAGAQAAIDQIASARDTINENRGAIGSSQSRLGVAFSNLQEQRVQSAAAKSRIVDADIAEETANRTRASILTQAGTSVLGQANQSPALALSLLGGGG